jgi:uncharacterized protein DUF4221
MKKLTFLILLLYSAAFYQCGEDQNSEGKRKGRSYFKEVSEIRFPLDSLTSFFQNSIQYREVGDSGYLSIFNEAANSIYEYAYDDKRSRKIVHFEKEGPNGIGSNYKMGHLIAGADSIFLLNYLTKELFLTNFEGKVLKKYSLAADDEKTQPSVQLDTRYTAYKTGKKIYFIGANYFHQDDNTSLLNSIVLDLESGEKSYHFPRPEIYNEGNWGYFKYIVYHCYNPGTKKLVYSFGVSDSLFETSLDFETTIGHPARSRHFGEIKPLTENLNETVAEERIDEYDMTTPCYGPVLFDKYNELYYRFAFLPILTDDYKSGDRSRQKTKTSIIVLDTRFKFIDEMILPVDGYMIIMYFINREGLHIAKSSRYKENEDFLTFGIFKLQPDE